MAFNFSKFSDLFKKFGASGKWNNSVNSTLKGVQSLKLKDDAGNIIQMVPLDKQRTSAGILKSFVEAQGIDAAIAALQNTPVNTVFKAVQGVQALPAKYTLGMIPGLNKVWNWINDKVLGAIKWMANEAGFQGVAGAVDSYQQLWDEGFKALGDNSGYKGNHDSWWQEKGFLVQTGERIYAYPTENTSTMYPTRGAQGSMVILLDDLAKHAADMWGNNSGKIKDAIDDAVYKFLQYRNFSQTLTSTAISVYLVEVTNLYANYIMLKKYYNCRNVEIIKGTNFRFASAYLQGEVSYNFTGTHTTHSNVGDRYSVITDYVSNKEWDEIDTFIERQYLPESIKQFIENMYGNFFRYDKQANSLFSIDPLAGYNYVTASVPYTTGTNNIMKRLNYYAGNVTAALQSVSASITGFLAKCGVSAITIPAVFKDRRSKTGEDSVAFIEADEVMRAAIDNAMSIDRSTSTNGFKWNATEDSIIISTDKHPMLAVSNNDRLDMYDLTAREANYLSKLCKFTFHCVPYSASIWGFGYTGLPGNIGWNAGPYLVQGDATFTTATYPGTTVASALSTLAMANGTSNGLDIFVTAGMTASRDIQPVTTFKSDNTIVISYQAKRNLTITDCELKVFNYQRLKDTAIESLAMSKQYAKKLNAWLDELNKAIDIQLT